MLCSLSKPLESESLWQGLGVVYFFRASQEDSRTAKIEDTIELNKPIQIHINSVALCWPSRLFSQKKKKKESFLLAVYLNSGLYFTKYSL